jgi:Domain of unknown function (DUF4410)
MIQLPTMKNTFLALGGVLLLSSCADVRVTDTQTAAVVTTRPSAIYIRPFSVAGAEFVGAHAGGPGELPLRESLAPAVFSEDLKEQLETLAAAHVLEPGEVAEQGWLVEGSIDKVDAGNGAKRLFAPPFYPGLGRSHVKIHVRVLDLDHHAVAVDSKDSGALTRRGRVIYEFDVAGGSHETGPFGSITAPAGGYSAYFDYQNSAERICRVITPDPFKYGARTTPTTQ